VGAQLVGGTAAQGAGDREDRWLAQEGVAQGERRDRQLGYGEIERQRRLGRIDRPGGSLRFTVVRELRLAQQLDVAGPQPLDFEAAGQQRPGVPSDFDGSAGEPGSLGIGDDQVTDRHPAQGIALQGADRDPGARAEVGGRLDLGDQPGTPGLAAQPSRPEDQGAGREHHQESQRDQGCLQGPGHSQNACPRLT